MIWFITKIVLRGLLILALLPVILGLLMSFESVNRWVFDRVMGFEPRLELIHTSGDLWRGWDFDRIVWRDEGIEMVVEDVSTSWDFTCLSGRRLCIEHIDIAAIRADIEPSEAAPDEDRQPIDLPNITLPVGIQLDRLQVGSVWLDEEAPILTDLRLAASLRDDVLVIDNLVGTGPGVDWVLNGDVRLSGDWPLLVRSSINLPEVDEQELAVDVRLGGTVADLDILVQTRGYIEGRLEGLVNPLEPELPANLSWRHESFLASSELPETLTLEQTTITLRGDLENGYAVRGAGSLPGEGGDIAFALQALARETGVDDLELTLQVADEPQRQVRVTVQGSWDEALAADVEVALEAFPWQWLYPVDLGEIEVQQLNLVAALREMDFTAELSAVINGVADQTVDLQVSAAGNPDEVNISTLNVVTPAGRATGEALVGLVEGVRWDARLLLEGLDPGAFVEDLPGSLNGPVASTGSLINEELELSAQWNLEGRLRGQPLQLSGDVEKEGETWSFADLLLRQGNNRVSGAGQWGEEIRTDLDIQMPDLEALWPGLSGSLTGRLAATGNPQEPVIALTLQSERLGYEDSRIVGLDVRGDVRLNEAMPGDLTVTAQHIRAGETYIGTLRLTLAGDKAQHRLALDLANGIVDLSTRLTGTSTDERWQGRLTEGEIASEEMIWRLAGEAPIDYRLDTGSLGLGAHCWTHAGANLCFEGDQRLLPDRQIALTLSDFPLASLQDFLPEDFEWTGLLDAQINLVQPEGGEPVADVQVSSLNGAVTVSSPEQTLEFPYTRLQLDSKLDAGQARNRFVLEGEDLGQLEIQANIDDPAERQALSGNYRLEGFKLDFIRPFLPEVEVVRGELNGNGTLAGTLQEPDVQGVVVLRDGQISGPQLPVSFEQLGVRVAIEGQRAHIQGDWRSGDGQGSLSGAVTWAPELDVSLALQGNLLPVTVPPYADLRVSPDMTVTLVNNQLRVRGRIAIPEGDITVRELPEQAVRVSPDAVIVGQEPEEEVIPLDISARVTLAIGDQLRFSGFGLTGRLSGRIQVEETMTASGDLNILDGRFRGYGQRLSLRRAQILFAGPISQPFLNIEAIRRVDDVVAGLRLTGRAEAPQSEVFSEPAMAQEQALSYLVLGRPLGGDGGDGDALGQAALALGLAGSGPLAQNIAGSLGIENFQLETEGSGAGTQVVAAGYLTDRLSLRYGVGVFEPANQVALRYDLTRRLYLEAVSGFASSLDFFYRIDF